MPRSRCNLLPKAAGDATASIGTITGSPRFEAMVVGDARVFGEDVVADVVHR
jgi:hypothetical protein